PQKSFPTCQGQASCDLAQCAINATDLHSSAGPVAVSSSCVIVAVLKSFDRSRRGCSSWHRREPVRLKAFEDGPNKSVRDAHCSAKPLSVFGKVFGNPGISSSGEWLKEKNTTVVLYDEI